MRVGIAGYGVVGKKRYSSIIKNTSFKVTDISEVNPTTRDKNENETDQYIAQSGIGGFVPSKAARIYSKGTTIGFRNR